MAYTWLEEIVVELVGGLYGMTPLHLILDQSLCSLLGDYEFMPLYHVMQKAVP